MKPNSHEQSKRHTFDSFCKKVLKHEARDYYDELKRQRDREVSFSDLSEKELAQLYTEDKYFVSEQIFNVLGLNVIVTDDVIAEALQSLPERKVGKDRSHLLTGLLRCPVCGGPMYTNKHAWTNKDGTYKEVYYYVCSRNRMVRGKSCTYKAMLKKTEIEPLVIASIKELVSNKTFAKEVKSRIGTQIDTTTIDREIKNYESKLREVDLNKARLENEIDTLPEDTRYRDRKLHDMTIRLDGLYDIMVELEEKIEDAKLKRRSVEMNAITLDNVYRLMIGVLQQVGSNLYI